MTDLKPIHGALIAIGFAAAAFAIGMGCGLIADWWKARKERVREG